MWNIDSPYGRMLIWHFAIWGFYIGVRGEEYKMKCWCVGDDGMQKYDFRKIKETDYSGIVEVYNSNQRFLLNHLGQPSVNYDFIVGEVSEMKSIGFLSDVIVDKDTEVIKGVIDYRLSEEVYLSLFMLDSSLQGRGLGRKLYHCFENELVKKGVKKIRIDVVNEYEGNVAAFWEKLGFAGNEELYLKWGNKKSKALVMRKSLKNKSGNA